MRLGQRILLILGAVSILAVGSIQAKDVVVWGSNAHGQRDVPAGLTDVTAFAAGGAPFALNRDGTVVAWGDGNTVPADLSNPNTAHVTAISSHYAHNLALKSDGTVVAWGYYNYYGQQDVPAGLIAKAIAAGGSHSLAVRMDGTVAAWGDNTYRQCAVPAWLQQVIAVAAGSYHSLALLADGTVVAWGRGRYDTELASVPNFPADNAKVTAIAAGFTLSVALRADGTVVEWLADVEVLGSRPELSGAVVTAISVNSNNDRMALKNDGTVVAWGEDNAYGELNVPAGLTAVTAIAIGSDHALAFGILPPDTTPPTLTVPADMTVEATSPNGAVVDIGLATATDNRDPNPVVSSDAPASAIFPLGLTTVTWKATDTSGNTTLAPQKVTVLDRTPPAITAPADVTAQQPGTVNIGTATATDTADPSPFITNNAPAFFRVGLTLVTWTATDHSGNAAAAIQKVTVVAPPPSTVKVSATPNSIWPPNGKMVPVKLSVTSTGGPAPTAKILSVTCNEAIVAADTQITGALTLKLRADRNGNGNGRVYTINVLYGTSSMTTVTVTVPHDQGK